MLSVELTKFLPTSAATGVKEDFKLSKLVTTLPPGVRSSLPGRKHTEMTPGVKLCGIRSMTRLLFFFSIFEVRAVEVLLAVLCERVIHKGYLHTFIVAVMTLCGWMFFQEMSQFCFI